MLAKVGITWQVQLLDPAAVAERMRKLDYDLATNTWTWIYDPDLLLTGWYDPDGGFNFGKSNNKKGHQPSSRPGGPKWTRRKGPRSIGILSRNSTKIARMSTFGIPGPSPFSAKNVLGWNNEMYQKLKDIQFWTHPLWFKDGKR